MRSFKAVNSKAANRFQFVIQLEFKLINKNEIG